jgi:putative CRISPR-associated protein (TIGR02619 family)
MWSDEFPIFSNELDEKLKLINFSDKKSRRKLSAELNTLDRIGLKSTDKVVLLSTDSAAGRICSQENEKIIKKYYHCDVEIIQVSDLQVYDSKLLRQSGLKNLVKIILDNYLTNDAVIYSYNIIINPTAGYKGIVPFLTVLGMIYGKYSVYLFEFSEELIHLPPLPISFDIERYERVKDALRYMDNEIAITKEDYFSKIIDFDPLEKEFFLSYTENYEDNLITLSPLAMIILNIDDNTKPCKISKNVQKTLDSLNGEKEVIIRRLISNSSNPLWRQQNHHSWKGSDFFIIKQGNTAERLAGFVRNGIYYVALAFANHDEYEKELGKYKESDFDITDFIDYSEEKLQNKEISTYDTLQRKYDLLNYKYTQHNKEKQKLENEKIEIELCYEDTLSKIKEVEKELSILNSKYIDIKKINNKFLNATFMQKLMYLFKKNI